MDIFVSSYPEQAAVFSDDLLFSISISLTERLINEYNRVLQVGNVNAITFAHDVARQQPQLFLCILVPESIFDRYGQGFEIPSFDVLDQVAISASMPGSYGNFLTFGSRDHDKRYILDHPQDVECRAIPKHVVANYSIKVLRTKRLRACKIESTVTQSYGSSSVFSLHQLLKGCPVNFIVLNEWDVPWTSHIASRRALTRSLAAVIIKPVCGTSSVPAVLKACCQTHKNCRFGQIVG